MIVGQGIGPRLPAWTGKGRGADTSGDPADRAEPEDENRNDEQRHRPDLSIAYEPDEDFPAEAGKPHNSLLHAGEIQRSERTGDLRVEIGRASCRERGCQYG